MDEQTKLILEELRAIRSEVNGMKSEMNEGFDNIHKKLDWAVAELKNDGKVSEQAMTLFTPIETTEAIERDLKAIKVKLFDVETKLNRR